MRKREYGMQIPNQVQWILDKLEKNGKEGYDVSGIVFWDAFRETGILQPLPHRNR